MSTSDPAGIAGTPYTSGAEALQALVDARRKKAAGEALLERLKAMRAALDRGIDEADWLEQDALHALRLIAEQAPEQLHLRPSPDLEQRIARAEDHLNAIEHQAASIAAEAWGREQEEQ